MRFSIQHTVNCSPETFWEVYFRDDYVQRLYLEVLGNDSVKVLEQSGSPAGPMTRRLESHQKLDAPGPVRKLIGDSIAYVEVGSMQGGHWKFRLEPSKLADKLKISGDVWLKSDGNKAGRICDMDVGVKMFGVGPVLEKFIEKQTRDSQEKAAGFTNAYLAEHGLS
jgi:ligand-binding SRPBCC domain-containing protein